MRTRRAGKITDNLWLLGREESCVYLLEGKRESMLINAAMSHIVPDVLQQFKEFGIDETRITKILILHSHFDHVGIAPFFKRRHKGLEILGSSRTWEILDMPKAVNTINKSSLATAQRLGREDVYGLYDLEWRDIQRGTSLSDGDIIDLGDMKGIVYETPGHSSCALSFYAPDIKTLFASDCVGIPFKESMIISANSNFTQYQAGLERLKPMDAEYICADHYGYISGSEAQGYVNYCIDKAREFRALLEKTYLGIGDIEIAAKRMTKDFYEQNSDYFLPPNIMEVIYGQMFRHISEYMKGK